MKVLGCFVSRDAVLWCSAFKAHHSGTTFYFAAERQDDMAKYLLLHLSLSVYCLVLNITPTTAANDAIPKST